MNLRPNQWVALALGLLLAVGFVFSQRPRPRNEQQAEAARPPMRRLKARRVHELEIDVLSEGVGTVRSRRQTQISARVLAEIKEVRKNPGDPVEAGETLVVLDSLELKARVEQAEANVAALDENLKEANTELARKSKLLEQQAATQQEHDLARFQLSSLTARRLAAQKALEEAKIQLGYATVNAPFAGVLYEKSADPGDLATPGKPLLGLYDPGQLRLEALLEEELLWKVKLKDVLRVKIDALPGEIQGVASETVPAVDPTTRTGLIKIDLPPAVNVRPGMFGRARVIAARRKALVVPGAALVRRGQLELVFTARAGADGKAMLARMTLVRSGLKLPGDESRIEVLSGLDAGELVLVEDAAGLRDGDPVDPVEEGSP